MKKLCSVMLVAATLLASAAPLAEAGGRGGGRGSGHGFHGGGGWRGSHWHGGGRVGFRGGVFIGGPFWGPWWGPWGYPYYAYPPPVYAPPVVIQQEPQVYIQRPASPTASSQPSYWYYCPDSKTYYPYVQQCSTGWLTVVPPAESAPR